LSADQIEPRALFTAFPEDANRRDIGAAVVLVKLAPEELEPPPGREGWAPEGIVAFSKICTHAGCAVSLYRTPLSEPTSHEPALVCPCHYSTFDVRRAAKVMFGPAGRPLPQLPLAIDSDRNLVAAGGFSGPVGPAWLSVRRS
jgi:ubiquinol-cytochrome c reductase iron-sulfur subunit